MIFNCGFIVEESVELCTSADVARIESCPQRHTGVGCISLGFPGVSKEQPGWQNPRTEEPRRERCNGLLVLLKEPVSWGKINLTRYVSLTTLAIWISQLLLPWAGSMLTECTFGCNMASHTGLILSKFRLLMLTPYFWFMRPIHVSLHMNQ